MKPTWPSTPVLAPRPPAALVLPAAARSKRPTIERPADRDAAVRLPAALPRSRTLQQPLRVAIASDVSGSTATSDPAGARNRATLLVCDWLADQSQNRSDQVGLVRFADRADVLLPVRASRARRLIGAALESPRDVGGGTRLEPAITGLCAMLQHAGRRRRLALVITDGEVAEPELEIERLFQRLHGRADAVYLIALDFDGAWTRTTRHRYQTAGLADQVIINDGSVGQLAHAIVSILIDEAGLATRPARRGGRRR